VHADVHMRGKSGKRRELAEFGYDANKKRRRHGGFSQETTARHASIYMGISRSTLIAL